MPTALDRMMREQRARDQASGIRPANMRVRPRPLTEEELEEMNTDHTPVHGWVAGTKVAINYGDNWSEDEIEKVTATFVVTRENGRFKIPNQDRPLDKLQRTPSGSFATTTFLHRADSEEARRGLYRQSMREFQRARMRGIQNPSRLGSAPAVAVSSSPLWSWLVTGKPQDFGAAVAWMQEQQAMVDAARNEYVQREKEIQQQQAQQETGS